MEESREEVWVYKITAQELITKLGLKGTDVDSIEEDEDEDCFVIRTVDEGTSPQPAPQPEAQPSPAPSQPQPTQNY